MLMLTILLSLYTIKYGKPNDKIRVHDASNTYFLKEHGFMVDYPPVYFVNAFMPKMNLGKKFCEKMPYSFSVETMCLWSNEKAGLMGMGGCKIYLSFQKLSVNEFEMNT